MGWCKKDVTPLLTHWSYTFLALNHRCDGTVIYHDNLWVNICSTCWELCRKLMNSVYYEQVTHWCLVTPYGDRDLGQHWLSLWLVAWRHKPLPELMLTYLQWGPKAFTWKKFHERCPNHQSLNELENHLTKTLLKSPRGQWVNTMDAILQMTLSNAISLMKLFEFILKYYWSLFLRVQLTVLQHWFR